MIKEFVKVDINEFYASGGAEYRRKNKECINTRGCYGRKAIPLEFWYKGNHIITDNFCSEECYRKYRGDKTEENSETRGVKKGIKRGMYNVKSRAIKDPREVTFICKECGRENTYLRTGKRIRKFCNDACKQKYYRQQKSKREIKRKKSMI